MSFTIKNIPEEYHEGFKKLFEIDEATFESITNGLSLTQLSQSIKKVADKVATVSSLPYSTLEIIFSSVGSLSVFLEKGIDIQEIAEGVCIALETNSILNLKPLLEREKFSRRLSILLQTKQLFYASKAMDICGEYKNVFLQARIVTDIRPIFNHKLDETPEAGLVIHNLHIHYRADEEGTHKDIFLALDSGDIQTLKTLLARAESKEKSLQTVFEKSKMINLNS